MYSYFMSYFYEDQQEDLVVERQKRLVYLLTQQIKKSKLKLQPIKEEVEINFIKPVPSSKIIKNNKIKKQSLSEFLSQKVK